MRLIDKETGKEVGEGDIVRLDDGTQVEITYAPKPHKPSSSGKVTIKYPASCRQDTYYPSVLGLEWIEREDQGWVSPEVELGRICGILQALEYNVEGWPEEDIVTCVGVVKVAETRSPEEAKFLHDWYKRKQDEIRQKELKAEEVCD